MKTTSYLCMVAMLLSFGALAGPTKITWVGLAEAEHFDGSMIQVAWRPLELNEPSDASPRTIEEKKRPEVWINAVVQIDSFSTEDFSWDLIVPAGSSAYVEDIWAFGTKVLDIDKRGTYTLMAKAGNGAESMEYAFINVFQMDPEFNGTETEVDDIAIVGPGYPDKRKNCAPNEGLIEPATPCNFRYQGPGGKPDLDFMVVEKGTYTGNCNYADTAPTEQNQWTGGRPYAFTLPAAEDIWNAFVLGEDESGVGQDDDDKYRVTVLSRDLIGSEEGGGWMMCGKDDSTVVLAVEFEEEAEIFWDDETHMEHSSWQGDDPLEHFCAAQDLGDNGLTLTHSYIRIWTDPETPRVKDRISWQGGDPWIDLRRTVNKTGPKKVQILVGWNGVFARKCVSWVIGAENTTATVPNPETSDSAAALSIGIWSFNTIYHWRILPQPIITDQDRPDLSGPPLIPVPGSGTNHVVSGMDLAGGANKRWDASRQLRDKHLNPSLVPQGAFINHPYYANAVQATIIRVEYPQDSVLGNDDAGVGDEINDPYNNGGLLQSTDGPQTARYHNFGNFGDKLSELSQFREFARVQLGSSLINRKWYRISGFELWRLHHEWQNPANAAPPPPIKWFDAGSSTATNNNGW